MSDALDAYRLLLVDPERVANEIAEGPPDLARWCADFAEQLFVTDALRTSRWLADALGLGAMPGDFAGIEDLGASVAHAIRNAMKGPD